MATKKMYSLNFSVGNELRAALLTAILDYEAKSRGLSRGQVLHCLIVEAADFESYPPDVIERLEKIAERTRRRAAKESLEVSKHTRVA